MDADTLARARAAIDAARTAAEEEASGYHSGAADDVPALAGAAAALVALVAWMDRSDSDPWWRECGDGSSYWCVGCNDWEYNWRGKGGHDHAPDCPTMAAEAALARLAGEG